MDKVANNQFDLSDLRPGETRTVHVSQPFAQQKTSSD
jgi:hypothetical protein